MYIVYKYICKIIVIYNYSKLSKKFGGLCTLCIFVQTKTKNIYNMNYKDFLEKKKHSSGNFGFDPVYYPDMAFDFQNYIIEKAIIKGRIAIFADTGLGKTLIQIAIAQNVVLKTNKKVLIITPLAVAFQFILEAEKMGISDIEYSKDGKLLLPLSTQLLFYQLLF